MKERRYRPIRRDAAAAEGDRRSRAALRGAHRRRSRRTPVDDRGRPPAPCRRVPERWSRGGGHEGESFGVREARSRRRAPPRLLRARRPSLPGQGRSLSGLHGRLSASVSGASGGTPASRGCGHFVGRKRGLFSGPWHQGASNPAKAKRPLQFEFQKPRVAGSVSEGRSEGAEVGRNTGTLVADPDGEISPASLRGELHADTAFLQWLTDARAAIEVRVVQLIGSQPGVDMAPDRAILERAARGAWRKRVARKPWKGLIDA